MSFKRTGSLIDLARSVWYYQTRKDDNELIDKLNELAEELPTRGLDEYVGRLRAQSYTCNRKRIYRVYKMLQLEKRRKRKRRLPSRSPEPLVVPKKQKAPSSLRCEAFFVDLQGLEP